MCIARLTYFALLSVVASAIVLSLPSAGLAQGYYPRAYGPTYRVPYRNDYQGYWRDQGYGFSGNRYGYGYGDRLPYRNDYHGYWRDQGYGFSSQGQYPAYYGYPAYIAPTVVVPAPVYPNVKWHPRSKSSYPR